jgi:hypothetical protein
MALSVLLHLLLKLLPRVGVVEYGAATCEEGTVGNVGCTSFFIFPPIVPLFYSTQAAQRCVFRPVRSLTGRLKVVGPRSLLSLRQVLQQLLLVLLPTVAAAAFDARPACSLKRCLIHTPHPV